VVCRHHTQQAASRHRNCHRLPRWTPSYEKERPKSPSTHTHRCSYQPVIPTHTPDLQSNSPFSLPLSLSPSYFALTSPLIARRHKKIFGLKYGLCLNFSPPVVLTNHTYNLEMTIYEPDGT
ncbi:unnamed protein product, partial [Ectocarpus sp. 6 AP-2014]